MEPIALLLIPVAFSVGLFLLGFWIWMLVDCIRYEPSEGNDKIMWVLLIVFTKFIGAAIYYFVRRQERLRSSSAEA